MPHKHSKKYSKNDKSNRHNNITGIRVWIYDYRAIIIIMFSFMVLISTYSYLGYRIPILDEGIYVGMGKNLFSQGASGFWERFRPLGTPIITGVGWSLGFNPYIFAKTVMILCATASILFVYLIAKKIFDKKIALIAALIFSITPLFAYYSEYVLTEIPSMLFILIGIYALLHDKYFVAGIASGIGFMFKFTQGIVLIAVALFLIINLFKSINTKGWFRNQFKDFIKKGALLTLGFMLAITPYIIFNYVTYHPYTHTLYDATIEPIVSATIFQDNIYQNLQVKTLGEQIYGWVYYLVNLFANKTFICLLYVFFFIFIYLFFKEKLYRKNEHTLLMLIFATYLLYFSSIPYKQERFVYFFVPIAAIYSAYAIIETLNYATKKDKIRKNNTLTIILIAIISSFALISVSIDASFPLWKHSSKPAVVTDLYEYFNDNNISGTIATGDMVLAIYTDNKLTNMFELRADIEENGNRNINSIFYADYTYPCLDEACVLDRTRFFDEVAEKYDIVQSSPCYSGNCYIYVKKE